MAFDDDSGQGYYSRIANVTLTLGTYYLKVCSGNPNQSIPQYQVGMNVTALQGSDNGQLQLDQLVLPLAIVAVALVIIGSTAMIMRRRKKNK